MQIATEDECEAPSSNQTQKQRTSGESELLVLAAGQIYKIHYLRGRGQGLARHRAPVEVVPGEQLLGDVGLALDVPRYPSVWSAAAQNNSLPWDWGWCRSAAHPTLAKTNSALHSQQRPRGGSLHTGTGRLHFPI